MSLEAVEVWRQAKLRSLADTDPQILGPYRLVGRLGRGGMGSVYLGVDADGTPAAVKVLHNDLADSEAFRARFRRELELAARVSGSCTARILDADVDGDPAWIAMEYVAGPTLAEQVELHGPLDGSALVAFAAGMAEALVVIHDAGVVHRDLTSRNVLLSEQGPRVVDFGIARTHTSTTLTATATVLGTPGWLAPEVIRGGRATESADVFAWAALVAFAASGTSPFGDGRAEQVMYRQLNEDPEIPTLPGPLQRLVRDGLSQNPQDRPTARQVVAALTAAELADDAAAMTAEVAGLLSRTWKLAVELTPLPAPPPSRQPRWRSWGWAAAVGALLLAGGVLLALPEVLDGPDAAPDEVVHAAVGEPESEPSPPDENDSGTTESPAQTPEPPEEGENEPDELQSSPEPDVELANEDASGDDSSAEGTAVEDGNGGDLDDVTEAQSRADETGSDSPGGDLTEEVVENAEETETPEVAQEPPDPHTITLSSAAPEGYVEVERLVASRDEGPPGVLVLLWDEGHEPALQSGRLAAALFEWVQGEYRQADYAHLSCYDLDRILVDTRDSGFLFAQCPGGASARYAIAVTSEPYELQVYPQSWAEDEPDGWLGVFQELVALDGNQVQVELVRNTCLPSCAEGLRMTYHLVFERATEQFLVNACGVHEGELHPVDPPVDVTYDNVLTEVDEFCGP